MEKYVLDNTGNPRVRFTGELLGSVSEEISTGTTKVFELYRTSFGRYICHKQTLSQWEGVKDKYSTESFQLEHDVVAFFGYSDLAKELYQKAQIDESIEVK